MAESLKGKAAVISGVGSGFGKATAELFARLDQVGLVLIDLNEQALNATADACRAAGSQVVALPADVTRPDEIAKEMGISEEKVREKLTYMHENPVRAGLVAQPCDWAFSSARYYEQGRSVGVPIRWIG